MPETSTIDQLVVGMFGLLGMALTMFWGNVQRRRANKEAARADIKTLEVTENAERQDFIRNVVNPMVSIPQWAIISAKIEEFQERTQLDRIILFVCVNGKNDPKETNGIYQWRTSPTNGFKVYLDVDIARRADNGDYVGRLHHTKNHGKLIFKVAGLPDCLIKDIYEDENINEAIWLWMGSVPSHTTGQVAGVYLSATTPCADKINPHTAQELQNLSWELSGIMKKAYAQMSYELIID